LKKKYLSNLAVFSLIFLVSLLLFSFSSLAAIPGDFNADGKVDFEDLMIFALAYGSTPSDTNWNPSCDLLSDSVIDFEDLMLFAMNYGGFEQHAIWTVMVYMCGDNNLDYYAWYDLNQMQSVGSTGDVNIVTQVDPHTSCSGTYRYHITGADPGASYPLYPDDIVQSLSEQNMADPSVLNNFVSWAMNYYPAEKYLLILWDHGEGWRGENTLTRGIIIDETSGDDYMTMADLVQGLEGIPDSIDIIGFDACLMQMAEVYYEIASSSGTYLPCYGVGSQASEWANGWPYDTILTYLTVNPSMSESELCETIVNNYINNCGSYGTMSALNFCSGINPSEVINCTNSFANALMNSSYQSEISLARLSAQSYDSPDYKDLYHFAKIIYDNVPDCQNEAQPVMNMVDDVVFANQYTGIGLDNSHGLSIYLPDSPGEYEDNYNFLQFAIDTQWDEFLKSPAS